jgi:hypothetical protein
MQGFPTLFLLAYSLLQACSIHAFQLQQQRASTRYRKDVKVSMGLFDFFQSREDDFVKLETTSIFGPGPLIIMYNIPNGLLDDEIQDMITDGAPQASKSKSGGVRIQRLYPMELEDPKMRDLTVQQVLEQSIDDNNEAAVGIVEPNVSPILYFSGISNTEMMETYNIIAREVYEESNGTMTAACAKVVEPAMEKNFSQLVEEISGDHAAAMQSTGT